MIFKINIGNNGIHPFLVITTDGKEAKTTVEKLVLNKLKKFVNKFNEEQSDEA